MYRQPIMRKSTGFFEDSDHKNRYANAADHGNKDTGRVCKTANLQEIFLNNCRKNENIVNIELLHGEKKTGKIVGFDSQSVILSCLDSQILIYKSSIVIVVPANPVQYIFNELHRHEMYGSNDYEFLHAGAEESCNNA